MFKFILSMKWYVKKNWYRYLFVLFFGLLLPVVNLIPAELISRLTKAINENTVTYDFLIYQMLIPFTLTIIGIYIIATSKRISQVRLRIHLYNALQRRYVDNILIQDASFFERFQSGDLLTRALGDLKAVNFSGGNRLINIVMESMTVIITFIAMSLININLAIICVIPLSFIFISNILLKAKVKRNWKIVRQKASLMGNVVLESITNVRTIRAYQKEDVDYNKRLKYSKMAYDAELANLKINVIFNPLFQFIVAISIILCYGFGAYFYSINSIDGASLIKFVMYISLFQGPLTAIGNLVTNFYQSLISADRLNEVYDSKSEVIDDIDSVKLDKIESIEFKDFKFKYYNDDYNTLNGINLKINKGETIGIVGATGSGKSSIVRQLVRQLKIDNNSLYINDYPVEHFKQESIREHISYVPQEHILLSRSVYENIKLGKKDASEDEVLKAIAASDFAKDIKMLTNGLDTIVGEYGVTLSGGQKQRLSIARALLKNSDVLILDDSLSAVDGDTEANIINNLKEYRKDKTNIIVAHRLSAVMHATKIVVVEDGKIKDIDTHDNLMKKKSWYYDQFMNQQITKDGDLDEE